MRAWVSVNGVISPGGEARVSVLDHGFLYGDSVYETLRTYGGRPFLLEAHLERLAASGRGLRFHQDFAMDDLVGQTQKVLDAARFPESIIRMIWTRGVGDIGYDPDESQHSTLVVVVKELAELPRRQYEEGIVVALVDVRRNPIASLDPRIKTSNLLNPRLAYMQAREAGASEALMLTQDGHVAEGSRTNFFLVSGGVLRTPSVESGILNGVTRRLTLQLARGAGIPAEEAALPAAVLQHCEEAFITGTTFGIVPVSRLADRTLGPPGPVTRRLMQAYDAFVASGRWVLAAGVGAQAG